MSTIPLLMGMEKADIYVEAEKALQVLANSQQTYLQSTIFILRAERAALMNVEAVSPTHSGFTESYRSLQGFAGVMGMTATQYLEGHLFITQISALEFFLQSCLTAVLRAYPNKLNSTQQFTLPQILAAGSKEELINRAVETHLNELMYKKPLDYLNDFCRHLSISPESFKHLWPTLIEAKARRDVGIHNNWVCNSVYLRKVGEAQLETSFTEGDSLLPDDPEYFTNTVVQLGIIAQSVVTAIKIKFAPEK